MGYTCPKCGFNEPFTTWKFLGFSETELMKMVEFYNEHHPDIKAALQRTISLDKKIQTE